MPFSICAGLIGLAYLFCVAQAHSLAPAGIMRAAYERLRLVAYALGAQFTLAYQGIRAI